MKFSTVKNVFPNLYNLLESLAHDNCGVLDFNYDFPHETWKTMWSSEDVLEDMVGKKINPEILLGEYEEGRAALEPYGVEGEILDGFLNDCWDAGKYAECTKSRFNEL